jgi:hypothetical protein
MNRTIRTGLLAVAFAGLVVPAAHARTRVLVPAKGSEAVQRFATLDGTQPPAPPQKPLAMDGTQPPSPPQKPLALDGTQPPAPPQKPLAV